MVLIPSACVQLWMDPLTVYFLFYFVRWALSWFSDLLLSSFVLLHALAFVFVFSLFWLTSCFISVFLALQCF